MRSLQINIINPKAIKLLHDLADQKLISIQENTVEDLIDIAASIRKKTMSNKITLEEITKEVKIVRSQRAKKSKK